MRQLSLKPSSPHRLPNHLGEGEKARKSLEKLAQVCQSWQRLATLGWQGGPRKSWQVKICTQFPSICFPGVKLIKWCAFSLNDSFTDQSLTSSLNLCLHRQPKKLLWLLEKAFRRHVTLQCNCPSWMHL